MAPSMAEKLADDLKVPEELRLAFFELYNAQGEASARSWKSKRLERVRSTAEVAQRIEERPELLDFLPEGDEQARHNARERLMFCGRYSAKEGVPLDPALDQASKDMRAAVALRAEGAARLNLFVKKGIFGDEHQACRGRGYPYRPSVSASHGSKVIEARAAEKTAAVEKGALLGYVAVQGGSYIDDIAVEPIYQGQSVATALIVGAAELACAAGRAGDQLSLDVRAANIPAVSLYQKLGFTFGQNVYPGFLDWDGGFQGVADAQTVREKLPENAVLEL